MIIINSIKFKMTMNMKNVGSTISGRPLHGIGAGWHSHSRSYIQVKRYLLAGMLYFMVNGERMKGTKVVAV